MKTAIRCCLALSLAFIHLSNASAESLSALLTKVQKYTDEGAYSKALEEMTWARKEIEKKHLKKIEGFFPDTLGEFQGQKFENNAVMGMMSIERVYVSGKNRVKLSMAGFSGGQANPMMNLGAMGAMAATMGGNKSFRIDGRTALLQGSDKRPEVSVFLQTGTVLNFNVIGGSLDAESLKAMANNFNLNDLDNYLGGKG